MTVPRGLLDGPIYLDYNATSPIARRATALHDLTDLFRHLHPEQVEHSWARRPELGYRYDHAHARRRSFSGSLPANTFTRPGNSHRMAPG